MRENARSRCRRTKRNENIKRAYFWLLCVHSLWMRRTETLRKYLQNERMKNSKCKKRRKKKLMKIIFDVKNFSVCACADACWLKRAHKQHTNTAINTHIKYISSGPPSTTLYRYRVSISVSHLASLLSISHTRTRTRTHMPSFSQNRCVRNLQFIWRLKVATRHT